MHQLIGPSLLDPRWFHQVSGGWQEATAVDSQSVNFSGQVLHLVNPGEITLTDSQKVYVRLFRNFYLETAEERQEQERKGREQYEHQQQAYREQKNRWRAEAETFNATLHIPVKWLSGMKDVLSGLGENSWGDGRNAASVTHIWLQEDLHEGKMHRSKGDFLCTSSSGTNGRQWSAQPEDYCFDGDGNHYQGKVTCKSCLKLAARWNV